MILTTQEEFLQQEIKKDWDKIYNKFLEGALALFQRYSSKSDGKHKIVIRDNIDRSFALNEFNLSFEEIRGQEEYL